jgi:Putative bacterial sensory transduction regulator
MIDQGISPALQAVRPFGRDMIKAFLLEAQLRHFTDDDGDFFLIFRRSGKNPELQVWLTAEGDASEIFSIRASARIADLSTARLDKPEDWYRLCNQWNQERRWPNVHVALDSDASDYPSVRLEGHLDLETGATQGIVSTFARDIIGASKSFFDWLDGREAEFDDLPGES